MVTVAFDQRPTHFYPPASSPMVYEAVSRVVGGAGGVPERDALAIAEGYCCGPWPVAKAHSEPLS